MRAELLRQAGQTFSNSAAAYLRGEATAIHEVEQVTHAWGHARSQRDLLSMTDSDGTLRRIDFIGRVETFHRDLRQVLRILNVSDEQLNNYQRDFFLKGHSAEAAAAARHVTSRPLTVPAAGHSSSNSSGLTMHARAPLLAHKQANQREGFYGDALVQARSRIVQHLARSSAAGRSTLERIADRFRADFECLNYTIENHGLVAQSDVIETTSTIVNTPRSATPKLVPKATFHVPKSKPCRGHCRKL